jgi:GNAT superfamily N-acetyltransferase
MFADAALAARIDAAEARFTVEVAAPAAVLPIGGGVSVLSWPGSPLNKVIGAGFAGRLDEDELAAVEEAWRARGEAVRVELSALASGEALEQLGARGYRPLAVENVLGRPLAALPPAPAGIEVAAAGDDAEWRRIAVEGFCAPDGTGGDTLPRALMERVAGDLAGAAGVRRFVARVDGAAAGVASLRLDSGVAQLSGATTLPAFRRRGVQTAMLAARLAAARDAGCDLAVMMTAPGTRSQANAQRQGFALLYARLVLVLPTTTLAGRSSSSPSR